MCTRKNDTSLTHLFSFLVDLYGIMLEKGPESQVIVIFTIVMVKFLFAIFFSEDYVEFSEV